MEKAPRADLFWVSRALTLTISMVVAGAVFMLAWDASCKAIDRTIRGQASMLVGLVRTRLEAVMAEKDNWEREGLGSRISEELQPFNSLDSIGELLVLDVRGNRVASLRGKHTETLRTLADSLGVLVGRTSVQLSVPLESGKWVAAGAPLEPRDRPEGAVIVLYDKSPQLRQLRSLLLRIGVIVAVATVVVNVAGALVAAVLEHRRVVGLRRAEKEHREGALRDFARILVHELNNPLNSVAMAIQLQQRLVAHSPLGDAAKAELEENFQVASSELDRAKRILESFSRYSDPLMLDLSDGVELTQIVSNSLRMLDAKLREKGIEVKTEFSAPVHGRFDAGWLSQTVDNLVRNAIDAMPDGGTLCVRVQRDADAAVISVEDTGVGIEPDMLERIFEPYYSTKETGLGLGLAVSRRVAEAHGGTIAAFSTPGEGSRFVVRLPIRRGRVAQSEKIR